MKAVLIILAFASCSRANDGSAGGFIGKLLGKINSTTQSAIGDAHKNNGQWLSLINSSAATANDFTARVSDKVSQNVVNVLSDVDDLTVNGLGKLQDGSNAVLNVLNQTPVLGKVVRLPNQIASHLINNSIDFGKASTHFWVGAGEVGAAFSTSTTSDVAQKLTDATHSVTNKLSKVNDKMSDMASKGVSMGVNATSNIIQGFGNTLKDIGKWIAGQSEIPSGSQKT